MNELTDKKHFNYPNPLKNIVSLISSMMIKWILSYKMIKTKELVLFSSLQITMYLAFPPHTQYVILNTF